MYSLGDLFCCRREGETGLNAILFEGVPARMKFSKVLSFVIS